MVVMENTAIAKIAPDEARRILDRTCDKLKTRADSNRECLGREIMDSLREAGMELGARPEVCSCAAWNRVARSIQQRSCRITIIGFRYLQP
jgi:hypothetical protein